MSEVDPPPADPPFDAVPRVSVIVPARNRRRLLEELLKGLDAQLYRDFEVLIIDDGSHDGSAELARRTSVAGRPVRVLDGGGNGAVAARRLGVAAARGEILAFTDSDCVPDPDWLKTAMVALDWGADVVHGVTVAARQPYPLERTMTSSKEGLYPTCNVLYRKVVFEQVGGFDGGVETRWGFRADQRARGDGFGEDTVLAWRALRQGATFEFVPEAVVRHQVFPPDWAELFSRTIRVAGFPAMLREIPELRRFPLCRWRIQLGPRTRAPVYLLCVSLLCKAPRGTLATLAWWISLRWRELSRTPASPIMSLRALPAEMAIDLLTAIALLAGSARTRTLLL